MGRLLLQLGDSEWVTEWQWQSSAVAKIIQSTLVDLKQSVSLETLIQTRWVLQIQALLLTLKLLWTNTMVNCQILESKTFKRWRTTKTPKVYNKYNLLIRLSKKKTWLLRLVPLGCKCYQTFLNSTVSWAKWLPIMKMPRIIEKWQLFHSLFGHPGWFLHWKHLSFLALSPLPSETPSAAPPCGG